MKKLINVSPFMLLMVPVFAVMAISFTTNKNNNSSIDVAAKSKVETVAVAKVMSSIK